jgi:hypothetical protein
LRDKIENALNESRIMVLVAEVILGFEFQAVFQPGFHRLSVATQNHRLVSLGCMLLALALFLSPAAYHQIVEAGHLSENLNRFITRMTIVALIPFAVALGIDAHTVSERVLPAPLAAFTGVLLALTALFCWYGIETIVIYREKGRGKETPAMESEPTELKDRIKFVLMEARVVLPGAQALLGFQFAAVLTDSFEKMPSGLKMVHLLSLLAVAFCTILLMTPASFHRLVEHGESTERMEVLSRRMVLASMAFLAPGIAGDVLIVTAQITHSASAAFLAGGLTLLAFYGFWFGYMFYLKARQSASTVTGGPSSAPLPGK